MAKFYSPSGKAIQDTGVTPSFPVAEADATGGDTDDDSGPVIEPQPKPTEDLLLKKAIEVVSGKPQVASLTGAQQHSERVS